MNSGSTEISTLEGIAQLKLRKHSYQITSGQILLYLDSILKPLLRVSLLAYFLIWILSTILTSGKNAPSSVK